MVISRSDIVANKVPWKYSHSTGPGRRLPSHAAHQQKKETQPSNQPRRKDPIVADWLSFLYFSAFSGVAAWGSALGVADSPEFPPSQRNNHYF